LPALGADSTPSSRVLSGGLGSLAKTHRTSLLFKGDDFNKTEIRPAARSR